MFGLPIDLLLAFMFFNHFVCHLYEVHPRFHGGGESPILDALITLSVTAEIGFLAYFWYRSTFGLLLKLGGIAFAMTTALLVAEEMLYGAVVPKETIAVPKSSWPPNVSGIMAYLRFRGFQSVSGSW